MGTIIGIIVVVVIIYLGKTVFTLIVQGGSLRIRLMQTFFIIPIKKTEVIYDSENHDTGNYRLDENEPRITMGNSEIEPEKGYDIISISFQKNITRIEHITTADGFISYMPYLIYKITIGANVTFETDRSGHSGNIYDIEVYDTPFDYYNVMNYKYAGLIFHGRFTHFIGSYQEQNKIAGTYVFQGKIIRQYTWIRGSKYTFYEWKGQWIRQRGNVN
jgi:hypothetical protein